MTRDLIRTAIRRIDRGSDLSGSILYDGRKGRRWEEQDAKACKWYIHRRVVLKREVMERRRLRSEGEKEKWLK